MSLLDRGYVPCKIYVQLSRTDDDGNTVTYASSTPISTKASFQVENQSGTSSRDAESDKEGFTTESVYRMRTTRAFEREHGPLGPQAKVSWGPLDGEGRESMWEVFGPPMPYWNSPNTAHMLYTIRRR